MSKSNPCENNPLESKNNIEQLLQHHFAIDDVEKVEVVQQLWSGYGEIARFHSAKLGYDFIVKQISLPNTVSHPRGWHSEISNARKIESYQVESKFYQHQKLLTSTACKVPELITLLGDLNQPVIVMEDLDAAGYFVRPDSIDNKSIKLVLRWLANFHGLNLRANANPGNESEPCEYSLWPIGSYWHLATRQDELAKMTAGKLKQCASEIDIQLNASRYQTIIHGDAKLANFCFHHDGSDVAAVDFQYVGGGIGVKDVMYFFTSCLNAEQLNELEQPLLNYYFEQLTLSLNKHHQGIDYVAVESQWRKLYHHCWADFNRFLAGWAPEHFKRNSVMENHTDIALTRLSN
ncbi:ecdysteroid 22-kinase family protein [Thalassotalea crassostreae]|uniref:ecdysteroid 22-kinase family protein n=1 Tax=Thalassotalea crassostreae TaxID=1763536 RepID=UPI001D05BC3D|nr:ecdysteroid 22-kinase family protein [Thalassotalea crassostreae]